MKLNGWQKLGIVLLVILLLRMAYKKVKSTGEPAPSAPAPTASPSAGQ